MRQMLKLPQLPNGTPQSNLAGILPLSTLIELVDVETKLHSYELSGNGLVWNWPITPAGARLMLGRCRAQEQKKSMGCLLDDGGQRSPPLQCIDMRFGNAYSCVSSFTLRTCMEVAPLKKVLQGNGNVSHRLQRLEIVHVYDDAPETKEAGRNLSRPPSQWRGIKWFVVQAIGWTAWLAAVIISILCAMPFALSYLLILPVTGLVVRFAFGHRPRALLVEPLGPGGQHWRRSVVVANHFNEVEWTIFIGDSRLINALLNKPLLRSPRKRQIRHPNHMVLKFLLYVLIAGQWGLVLAVSALQNWDAIFISAAIIVCVCTSTFLFRTDDSIKSWLKSNHIGLERMSVTFSGRRAMLSAMVAINPDCQPAHNLTTGWVDHILERTPDWDQWEKLLEQRLSQGLLGPEPKWLVESIEEGAQKASSVNKWLLEREDHHNVPARPPPQAPFILAKLP